MAQAVVIGGGLAGCEAAWQLARRGVSVTLYEMRPAARTPFHETDGLAELVCSNSFKSTDPMRAPGMLKEELARLGSLLLEVAQQVKLPAGAALAVNRARFSQEVEARLAAMEQVRILREPVESLAPFLETTDAPVIIATGPATHPPLSVELKALLGDDSLYFYDATSPIVAADSLEMGKLFFASRYGKGGGRDYLNAPLDEGDYRRFRQVLLAAELAPLHAGDEFVPFEGCLPIEELARRSEGAMRFGPLRPVGLAERAGGTRLYAVVQLRREDALDSAFSLVGFQTRMTQGAQKEAFRLIPGLARARFIRFGRMHRNDYICAPKHLNAALQLRSHPHIFFAGQITGLEGYIAAIATGLAAGMNAARLVQGEEPVEFPRETALGAMLHYMANAAADNYAPTAFNLAMLPPVEGVRAKRNRREATLERARAALAPFLPGA